MAEGKKKYRFLFIQPFELSTGGKFADKYHSAELSKEKRLRMEYLNIRPLLEDVEWDFHGGPAPPYGDWAVETREEFAHVAAARLPIVREACESGKYNAIVLLGGGEPGFMESREIARRYGIPVTACAFSQMHIASMLGNKFSVIDFTETHNMFYYDLVVRHRFTDRCASIRNINFYHARPGQKDESTIDQERDKALRGEPSEAVERAVQGGGGRDRRGRRGGHHLRVLGCFLASIVSSKAPERNGMGTARPGGVQLRHRAGQTVCRSGGRCQRTQVSE